LQIDARNAYYIRKPGTASPNLRSKPEPEVVLAAILDMIGAKWREDAPKRHWRDKIVGASETDLLAFHFRSRLWTGSRIPEPEILGKVSGTVQNVLKSRIIRK